MKKALSTVKFEKIIESCQPAIEWHSIMSYNQFDKDNTLPDEGSGG